MLLITKTPLQPSARERQLEAEVLRLKRLLATFAELLGDAQRANEGQYRVQCEATGGPRFDPEQPFGSDPRKLGTLWLKDGAL
ncbi:hypothetical protein STRCI_001331 [Streptomyces cinnabarinus]|uniref:Uncharacterized protein n=1 Tax=Streptomyces cinnabarinus TaxID=67287 RepID=A0ABY7K8X0_9ACTN|nr:hypothetical protein [Streptomyces cinnabarinus]WAZ20230.1 hypothetical protein STRCI_001331 [Streptomyces cinnabarinus]